MRIGMPTLVELETFEENLKLCKSLALDFIEINMNLPMYGSDMDTKSIKALLKEYDLEVSLHVAERIDICELDEIIRKAYLQAMIKTFNIANELGAFLVNMHMSEGIYFKLPTHKVYLYKKYKDIYSEHITRFLEVVDCHIGQTCLNIENTGILYHDFVKDGIDKMLNHPQISLTYDIGHDITSGYLDQKYYHQQEKFITHYHIHDGTDKKNHLTLFSGDLDIEAFMTKVKYSDLTAVVEVKSKKDLIISIDRLRSRQLI